MVEGGLNVPLWQPKKFFVKNKTKPGLQYKPGISGSDSAEVLDTGLYEIFFY